MLKVGIVGLVIIISFILLFEIGSDSHSYKVIKPVLLTQENHSSEWLEYKGKSYQFSYPPTIYRLEGVFETQELCHKIIGGGNNKVEELPMIIESLQVN